MNLTCAIVDDEPLALDLLESYVNKTPFLTLKGKYSSAVQAMKELPDKQVDLLFLDIQMPELNGLEFSKMVDAHTRIVFSTAFEQYAIDGYKVNALDYLLKPISYVDFLQAANKAVQWFELLQQPKEEIESIYKEKSILFNSYPEAERMPGAWELLQKIKSEGLTSMVVTGSGQLSLLERLEHNFPGMFHKELMVTAFDVKYGKPHPEPYLMALKKGDLKADEAVVIENAPLGVEAGHKAGIFTIAVNTGPLDGQVLLDAGADLLFPSMQALCDSWDTILL